MTETGIVTSFTIDWISATFTKAGVDTFERNMVLWGDRPIANVAPPKGYNHCIQWESGMRIADHSKRPEQGVHVVMSGSCLAWYWAREVEWKPLMEVVGMNGGRTSRVDLAFDVRNTGITCDMLAKGNRRPYKGRGRTPRLNEWRKEDGSWTVYVGSRSSEKFMRIYDKAKERGDYASDYIRIELETKGEVAHAVGWTFAKESESECLGMARGLVRGHIDYEIPSWDAALEGEIVAFAIPKTTDRDTRKWLIEVCALALAKEMVKTPNDDFYVRFYEAVQSAYAEVSARRVL